MGRVMDGGWRWPDRRVGERSAEEVLEGSRAAQRRFERDRVRWLPINRSWAAAPVGKCWGGCASTTLRAATSIPFPRTPASSQRARSCSRRWRRPRRSCLWIRGSSVSAWPTSGKRVGGTWRRRWRGSAPAARSLPAGARAVVGLTWSSCVGEHGAARWRASLCTRSAATRKRRMPSGVGLQEWMLPPSPCGRTRNRSSTLLAAIGGPGWTATGASSALPPSGRSPIPC